MGGHIGKGAVSVVMVERVPADSRDKNVFVSIVVVIARSDAHPVQVLLFAGESRWLRYFRERSVFVLMKETVPIFRIGLVGRVLSAHGG